MRRAKMVAAAVFLVLGAGVGFTHGRTITVDANGNVGIGNAIPTTALHVGTATETHPLSTGDVLISSDLEVNDVLYLDGGQIAGIYGPGTVHVTLSSTPTTTSDILGLTSWLVQNDVNVGLAALMVNQTKGGDLFTASASGTTKFTIANNGNVTIDGSGTMLTVGGGTGKVNVGTVDPVYNIDGVKYATYMAGMVGIKEETTGKLTTDEYIPGVGYKHTIDFKAEAQGSDLWLFSNATDIKNNIAKLVVLLSPSDNTRVWYDINESQYTISIYSTRPTNVSYRFTAPRFDYALWTNYNTDPGSTGFIVNNGPLTVTGSGDIEEAQNESLANIQIEEVTAPTGPRLFENLSLPVYQLKDAAGNIINEVAKVSDFVAANVKVGAIQTKNLATQTFSAFQGTVDNLLITSGLASPVIQTEVISPLADKSDVKVKIGNENINSGFGKLIVENVQGTEVASIDTAGNATFSGTLQADEVKANDIVAGKIYADEIVARNGYFDTTNTASISGVTRAQIEEMLKGVEENQALLIQASTWNINTATDSANLEELAVSNLYVTDQAAVNSLSVSSSVTIGSDLIIQSTINDQQLTINSIDSLSAPLSIQSLALAPLEIMAGKVKVDTNGDVIIAGNLYVAGQIESSGLALKDNGGFGKLLALQDNAGNQVASIDASGSARFNSVSTDKLVIAGADATVPATNGNGEIETNATAGQAAIAAGVTEITIKNPNISDYTLVYVTPTSTTQNNVLYVKSKGTGFFTVGFSDPLPIDVTFNWWVIDVQSTDSTLPR